MRKKRTKIKKGKNSFSLASKFLKYKSQKRGGTKTLQKNSDPVFFLISSTELQKGLQDSTAKVPLNQKSTAIPTQTKISVQLPVQTKPVAPNPNSDKASSIPSIEHTYSSNSNIIKPEPKKNEMKESLINKNFFLGFFRKNSGTGKPAPKKDISDRQLLEQKKKKSKIKFTYHEHKRHLKAYLEKAGFNVKDEENISQKLAVGAIIFVTILTLYLFYAGILRGDRFIFILVQVFSLWIFIFPGIFVAFWVIFYFFIDFRIYNRRKQVEEVLPDFLQLASANINAGMPIDQALWFAVRPRFGILAKEIEEVAKSTIVGEDLGPALMRFSDKYDSTMLKRTVNLILEGIEAGGEIGALLNKISIDIQETRILKKDMAANVTTYVIFISFATLAAAPFLFALSGQLLRIIQNLVSNINIPKEASSGGMISLSFSSTAITLGDFNIFAIATLTVTSFFSAVIISTIMYGNVKDGIKYIPIFIIVSVTLFLIASKILSFFLGGIF